MKNMRSDVGKLRALLKRKKVPLTQFTSSGVRVKSFMSYFTAEVFGYVNDLESKERYKQLLLEACKELGFVVVDLGEDEYKVNDGQYY